MKYLFIFSLIIAGCSGSGGGGGSPGAPVVKVASWPADFQSRMDLYESSSIAFGFGAVDNLIIEFSNDATLTYETISGVRGICIPGENPKILIYEPEWTGQTNELYKDAALYHLMGHCHAGKVHNADMGLEGPSSIMYPEWNRWIYTPNLSLYRMDLMVYQGFWQNEN